MTQASRRGPLVLAFSVSTLALILAAGLPSGAWAADAAAADTTSGKASVDAPSSAAAVSELVVNGVPYKETVLPTRLSTSSVYGLDLSVLDTPRNTTLISAAQLQALNIQDPRAFSYLTASSYTDSSFGTPNIPRIRGQYADVFYNGMRESFTQNGYGAPPNFDAFANIAITKGPASVADGPGPGVGGSADFITKRPSLSHASVDADASFDTVGNRRWLLDISAPLVPGQLGLLLSYSGARSSSFFYGHFDDKDALYYAVRWQPNDQYQLDFSGEINKQQYTENVGVNRVNQALIDHGQYLQGGPDGNECYTFFSAPCVNGAANGTPIGSPTNPFSPLVPILTEINLTNSVPLNTRITIDQTPGVFTQTLTLNDQLIQTYRLNDHITLEDNAFFAYQDSENREPYYYADASLGSWTFENKADAKIKFDLPLFGDTVHNEVIVGVTWRYAHVNYISDFNTETPLAYDLTSNPNLWTWDINALQFLGDAFPYTTSFGHTQYGVPGRDATSAGNTGVSDLYDTGIFLQHRLEFSPQFSVLYGGRIDIVQNHTHDPLPCTADNFCAGYLLPADHSTGIYGLGNGNISLVYRPQPWVSGFVTFDFNQFVGENGGEGGINTYGVAPGLFGGLVGQKDSALLRNDSYLYEAGLKFNILHNKLFAGIAGFDQKRGLPTGPGGTSIAAANIRGVEAEFNYQPTRNLFATASYSYIKTTLNSAAGFYNYAAQPGINIDGAGLFAVFAPGQKFDDPGVPQHIFNFLGNYKFNNGFGIRMGVQVTGPIETTTSGQLNLAASSFVPANIVANGGYVHSPVIPWQYTANASVFYEWSRYTLTLSLYNFTDQLNWQSSPPFYGNDFLVRTDPRTFEVRLQAKF